MFISWFINQEVFLLRDIVVIADVNLISFISFWLLSLLEARVLKRKKISNENIWKLPTIFNSNLEDFKCNNAFKKIAWGT